MISPADRITYAEARRITGRSHGYLRGLVNEGVLSREGGRRQDSRATWLSRVEVENLALQEYRRGRRTGYWLTVAEAAEELGVARQHAYRLDLQVRVAANGDRLVRWQDLARQVLDRPRSNPCA